MGNMQCPPEDAAHLAAVAQDICPFPNYNANPHFYNLMSTNSSVYLNTNYIAIQASLNPKQLEDFTQNLKTVFGREGKVSHGSVGVVALSLFVLFESVAKQVKGEYVSDNEPIPGLFLKDLRGYYPPQVYTISKYLRLVPHIANNPTRMLEESKRCMKQLMFDDEAFERQHIKHDDVTVVNNHLGKYFQIQLYIHLHRMANETVAEATVELARKGMEEMGKNNKTNIFSSLNEKSKPAGLYDVIYSLNCDPEAASKVFLDEIKKSDQRTQDAFKECEPTNAIEAPQTWLHYVAQLVWEDVTSINIFEAAGKKDELVAQREDFDLKVGGLGRWTAK